MYIHVPIPMQELQDSLPNYNIMKNINLKFYFFVILMLGFCGCKKDSDCSDDPTLHRLGALFGTWNVVESSSIFPNGQINYTISIAEINDHNGIQSEHCMRVRNYTSLGNFEFICFYPGQNTTKFPTLFLDENNEKVIALINHELTQVSNSRIEFKRIEVHCNNKIEFHGVMTKQ